MNLVIRNVRLIDGTGAPPVPSVNVVVEDGIISWIGEGIVNPSKHPHYEDINAEDLTLVPGWFDCHEHFSGDGGRNGVMQMDLDKDSREVIFFRAAANARRALLSGQTSARDVGSPYGIGITLARAVAAGSLPGPRITAAGQWIQMPTTWPYGIVRTVESAQEMRKVIRDQIVQGAGLIKVGATGVREDGTGYGTLGPKIAKLVADMAHKAGLKAAAHCVGGFEGTYQAVAAGIDSIEHCSHVDEKTAKLMAKNGTFGVPTMSTFDYRLSHTKVWGLEKDEIAASEARKDASVRSFKNMLKYGVKIACGTDAGGSPVRHGTAVHEMEVMVRYGMTPAQALDSATRLSAELTGTLDHVGTVEPGKLADMVLVDGDPLSDIGSLRNVWAAFQGGRRIR
jgi:imidazolonepropionase-like amidohydrolase